MRNGRRKRYSRDFLDFLNSSVDMAHLVKSCIKDRPWFHTSECRHWKCRCPFHHERTPSFTVYRDTEQYHCYGCGAHGGVITFVMEYNRTDFVSAVEFLIKEYTLWMKWAKHRRKIRKVVEKKYPRRQTLFRVEEYA